MIRCDEPMRHKKEIASKKVKSANQFVCKGNCSKCICALRKKYDGTWEHI